MHQKKRFLKLTRAAECFGPDGKTTTGYIGEELITNWFSLSYVFHFYDAKNNEVGSSKKFGNSCLNDHELLDNQGNIDFDIDKLFTIFSDSYVLTVKDNKSTIPLEHAVLLVCIEDAIGDAQKE